MFNANIETRCTRLSEIHTGTYLIYIHFRINQLIITEESYEPTTTLSLGMAGLGPRGRAYNFGARAGPARGW